MLVTAVEQLDPNRLALLIMVLVKRLGGEVEVPQEEVDMLAGSALSIDANTITGTITIAVEEGEGQHAPN